MNKHEAEAAMTLIRALFDSSRPSLFEAPVLPTEEVVRQRAMYLWQVADDVLKREGQVPRGFVPMNQTELKVAALRVMLPCRY